MAILKSREELLPVTCAVLKDEHRKDFFDAVQTRRGGKPEQVAKALSVPVSAVQDWISGKVHIPYHILQRVAHEFGLALPLIGELRRESQAVIGLAKPAPRLLPPEPAPRQAKRENPPRGSRRAKEPCREPQARKQASPGRRPRRGKPAPRQQPPAKGGKGPPLSDALAYWVGTYLVAAKRSEESIVFSADRHMGQNFAGTWARRTQEIFGAAPRLTMKDGGKVQEAACSAPDIDELLACAGVKQAQGQGPVVPRWVWSNPTWKTACLKGLMDAGGRFQRIPALTLQGLPEPLARSAHKILAALGFKSKLQEYGSVTLAGKEDVEKYYTTVGTDNMKLRDQLKAYFGRAGAPGREPETATRDLDRVELETEREEIPEPASKTPNPAAKRPVRSRRTLYRGRLG